MARHATAEQKEMAATLKALAPGLLPDVRAAAEPLTTSDDPDDYYRFGLEMILGGIRAIVDSGATL